MISEKKFVKTKSVGSFCWSPPECNLQPPNYIWTRSKLALKHVNIRLLKKKKKVKGTAV